MKFFGATWNPLCCGPGDQVPTPIGSACLRCDRLIVDGDQGFLMPYVTICELEEADQLRERGAVLIVPYHTDCYIDALMPCGCEICCRKVNQRRNAT